MTMYAMTDGQFQTVYNILSFALASMMATTIFLWMRVGSVDESLKAPLIISGLVTFIAAYHYMRIFNSWDDAYMYDIKGGPYLTGKPFNDAYRYMDWFLTVPMLLMEIVLCMKFKVEADKNSKCLTLGVSSALMIVLGYPGELVTEQSELSVRWKYWGLAMIPFLYVVYTLLVGLQTAVKNETDAVVQSKLNMACWVTVISWLTYPFVYIIPMFGAQGSHAVVGIQVGYCVSDIISKCGVGLIIYQVTLAKSNQMRADGKSMA